MSGTCICVRDGCLLSVSRGPGEIAWPLGLVEWGVRVGVDCRACVANEGKGGGLVRSRRTGVSVFTVYWSVVVTIVDVCCVYWFESERLR